ncbi:MAG: hypothetical protein JW795_18385 [Chitinivibrionales bacterium]|nr:hypothetical protein [Chitinivibrionales bacterium]
MNASLKSFKNDFLENILEFLWRQWSALGVAGYSQSSDTWTIDPEALLLLSLSLSRYEPRLFDEIMDWLATNGSMMNIQRIKSILSQEHFQSQKLMSAVAFIMSKIGKAAKWNRLSQINEVSEVEEELFIKKNGEPISHFGRSDPNFYKFGFLRGPLKIRGHTKMVGVTRNTGLLFKLRALWGINARAEIMLYLLTHETGHPRKIAQETYYFQKTVQDALVEMARSGIIGIQTKGKEKHYWIRREDWFRVLQINDPQPVWITWPPLLRALELIWFKICEPDFLNSDDLLQSSELRQLMKSIRPAIVKSGFGHLLSDDVHYLGEAYIPVFISDIDRLFEKMRLL